MAIRREVQELVELGPFPASDVAEEHDLYRRQILLESIAPPVNAEEAVALMRCFGPDDTFGCAWTLLHLIETTSGGVPLSTKPSPSDNEWVVLLWDRSHR